MEVIRDIDYSGVSGVGTCEVVCGRVCFESKGENMQERATNPMSAFQFCVVYLSKAVECARPVVLPTLTYHCQSREPAH